MAWWIRLIVTLVLAPLLWRLVTAYVASVQGSDPMDLVKSSGPILLGIYIGYTLPAAAMVAAVLTPVGYGLRRIGADLLIVGVAPLLACLTLIVLALVVKDPRIEAATGLLGLAFAYGLVWGLTIREPRAHRRRKTDAPADPALFEATL